MKNLIAALLFLPLTAFAGGEMKKVCHMEKNKAGKEVEVCKTVKVHKKLESSTKVPPK